MGTGLGHYIPFVAYLGFWIAIVVSLVKRPLFGLYYMTPFLPYRTLRDHFLEWPLGGSVLTFLIIAVLIGAFIHGKHAPKSPLLRVWFIFAGYLYLSTWLGSVLTAAPAPLWLSDLNFVTWKDYMLMPLVFLSAAMVIEDRKHVRTLLLITAFTVFAIDRSSLIESLSRSWATFDENKRSPGPLAYGSNQTAAFMTQFAMLFWGLLQFLKRKKARLIAYGLTALTLLAMMYCFSRAAYIAVVVCVAVLGILKDRKLILVLGFFLLTWETVVPAPVTQRINMTHDDSGHLEASAQERVDLWTEAEGIIAHYPVFGLGFATYQYGQHADNLRDTHNWYIKVFVETGFVGFLIVLALLWNMFALAIRLFRKARDPLYRGLGLGLLLCFLSLVITNFFGDRWTYIEINGLLWVLVGAAVRVNSFPLEEESAARESEAEPNGLPAYAYREWGFS